ncbi:MAG: hypothetical protein ACOC35_16230 [Promethearchaeia archaeon]
MGQNGILSKKAIAILIIFIILFVIFATVLFSPEIGHIEREHGTANVLLFSKQKESPLSRSLNIDENAIDLTIVTEENYEEKWKEEIYKNSDVIVVDRFLPENITKLRQLISRINGSDENYGLIFFGGTIHDAEQSDFTSEQISVLNPILPFEINSNTNTSTDDRAESDYKIQVTLNEDVKEGKEQKKDKANVLVRDIAWTSCPLISKRLIVKPKSDSEEIVESIDNEYSIVAEWTLENDGGTVLAYSMLVSGKNEDGNKYNEPFTLWPYFNYLMYASVFHVKADFKDTNIESFAEWPFSPIPHLTEIILWFTMITALWVVTIYWFLKMRKKRLPKPNKVEKKGKNSSENSKNKN